ncbi:probable transcription factor MYB58 [Brachypodium distachyon]|nr:probable transcription factor MYB58 [Brachypodium distachyon]|eukprot:XP_010240210.3 probable transcription factor MYB58 [Brachypodium distachyon]
MAEEDEALLEHVRTHGPCDWSSIRSKGILPRTGKSCRLRWVNKLRPNLKSGCKFSAEEERVVIELQAQFGNKWARIATYLPGRTDNDVKNFWSTRQKRLARLLRAPLRGRSSRSSNAKAPASSLDPSVTENLQCHQGSCHDHVSFLGTSSSGHCWASAPLMEYQVAAGIPHDQESSAFFSFEGPLPLQAVPQLPLSDGEASSSNAALFAPELPFDQPPYHLLDFPGLSERCNIGPGFVGASAMDDLAYQELLPIVQPAPTPMMLPFFGMECGRDAVKIETRDDFFDDLPPDMFDSLDQPPPPLSPSATN